MLNMQGNPNEGCLVVLNNILNKDKDIIFFITWILHNVK